MLSILLACPGAWLWLVASPAPAQQMSPQKLARMPVEALLASPDNAAAGLTLLSINTLFITHGGADTLRIRWQPDNRRAVLRFATRPGSGLPENYPEILPDQGLGQIITTGFSQQPIGIYYCVLQDIYDPALTSMEFRIFVQPSTPVRLLDPLDKATLPGGGPQFRWEPIDGVPYYYLLLSRGELRFETDPVTGDIVSLSGVNIIWQAFTTQPSIEYGAADPSGIWPPEHIVSLIPGERYHWLVFSAFAPKLTHVAWRLYPIRVPSFTIRAATTLPQPQILAPQPGQMLSADDVVFHWRSVPGASRYRVLLYEEIDDLDVGAGTLLVWQHTTLDTTVRFYARAFLARERYQFQIIAESPTAVSASATVPFQYASVSGFLTLRVVDAADFSVVPYARLDLMRRGGAHIPLPFASDRFGTMKLFLPEGEYRIQGTAPGYVPSQQPFSIDPGDTLFLTLPLPRAAYRLQGRIVSADGQPVPFPTILFPPGSRASVSIDGLGRFSVFSAAPVPSLRIVAPGFAGRSVSAISYDDRRIAALPDVVLSRANARIAGQLSDGFGLPVNGVRFHLSNGVDTLEWVQPKAGRFEFELEPGVWTIIPEYPGYYSQPPQYQLTLAAGQTREAPFVFYAGALIEGRVFAAGEPLKNATVELLNMQTVALAERHTDAFGRFRFDVRPGSYRLRVSRAPFAPQELSLTLHQGETAHLDLSLSEQAVIWGRVTEGGSAQPLQDVEIVDTSTGKALSRSDVAGWFAMAINGSDPLQLDARLPGFVSDGPKTVTPVPADSVRVDFFMQPAQAIIAGTVRLRRSPLAGAQVRIAELNQVTRTDASGRFSFEVQPGAYQLEASYQCFKSEPVVVQVGLGQTSEVQMDLAGSAVRVTGQVFDLKGRPLPDAAVLATGEQQATARTDSTGTYELCLPPGPYFMTVSKIGYQSADTTILVTENDSLMVVHFWLLDNFARILGRVQTADQQPIAGVNILLTNFWQQLAAVSDSVGRFVLEGVIPGESTILARSQNFFAQPLSLTLAGSEERQLTITMVRSDGFLAGRVIDGYTGAGIDSAMVVAQLHGSSAFFPALSSGPEGRFHIDNVPNFADARFTLLASKAGFVLRQPQKNIPANSDSIELVLLGADAIVSGFVLSADTQEPIAGATVILKRQAESPRTATTNHLGRFEFANAVFTRSYQLIIQHPRFHADTLEVVAPSTDAVYRLQRKLAFASGTVIDRSSGRGFAGASVIFTNLDGQGRNETARADSTGRFAKALWPGEYQITAIAPMHFPNPPQFIMTLAPADSLRSLRFEMEKQILKTFTVAGPSQITLPGESVHYRVVASDTAGRTVREVPAVRWWTNPGPDTIVVQPDGEVRIQPGYAGSFIIGAVDSASGLRDSMRVQVISIIDSSSNLLLFAGNGMALDIRPGTVARPVGIHFETGALSPVQNLEERFRVLPPVYKIIPQNVEFVRHPSLSLPVPETAADRRLRILRWESNLSAWDTGPLETNGGGVIAGSRVQESITRGGTYAVVALSRPLAVEYLELRPNPFSPQQLNELGQPGIVIRFSVTSDRAALPLVTAKIYNLQGNLVAILANQKPVPKGPQHLVWDGRTLTGYLARNGRYILHFIVEDGRHTRELLKSIVLVQ
ncbi:MAG: carboxypeptidase-like regulatory domain-containing protein [candidate division KSB1 bacterium]|nr:carboxypeptidase-like regulatory domain-containing protein [candidate division KSB1 bacterium]MDQ7063535.1 carboxypeptidase-like regulatory domain-containing protein [candidate division KSB1 bacterium]